MPVTRSLQELIIAGHFETPLSLTVIDIAKWAELFSNFPIIQQLPSLPRMEMAMGLQMQFQMAVGNEIPRMLLRSQDGRFSVQLQADRFAFGWHRTELLGEPSNYPGFENIRSRWDEVLGIFEKWTLEKFHQVPRHRLIELAYNNAIPLDQNGKKKRISDIFRFVQPGSRPVFGFSTTWTESVYPSPSNPSVARITTQVGLSTAPPDQSVLAFIFSGAAIVEPQKESKEVLNDLHDKIREIYESSIISDAT